MATATALPSATDTPAGYPVKIYFSRHPDSNNTFTTVVPVTRVSPTLGVGTFAIQEQLAGPSGAEVTRGLFTELTAGFTGVSNCGTADVQYTINNATHGNTAALQGGVAAG